MQASPSYNENIVDVMLVYEPIMKEKVREVLIEIEEIYQEFF